MSRLKLPTGIPSFEVIRSGGCAYVDKTGYKMENGEWRMEYKQTSHEEIYF